MNALQVEGDPLNAHMLLGGLFLSVQDSALYETAEHVTQPVNESAANLLSSGKFSIIRKLQKAFIICIIYILLFPLMSCQCFIFYFLLQTGLYSFGHCQYD